MTTLAHRVHVARRFRKAIRIDTDISDPDRPRRVRLSSVLSCGLGDYG